jgi:hypothetical protein
MLFSEKRLFLRLMIGVYMIFSLPAVFYVGYKTIKKIAHISDINRANDDFYMELTEKL